MLAVEVHASALSLISRDLLLVAPRPSARAARASRAPAPRRSARARSRRGRAPSRPTCASGQSATETLRRTPEISAFAMPASASTSSTICAGIPRHMLRSSSLRLPPGRSYAAVVRRHEPVGEDAEAERLEPRARRVEQPQVLEAAAGEHDRLAARRPRRRRSPRPGGDGLVEARRRPPLAGRPARSSDVTAASRARSSRRSATGTARRASSPASCSSSIAAWPSYVTRSRTPRSAATASNRRPIPEASGGVELQALAHERPRAATAPAARRARGGRRPSATARGSPPRRRAAARARGGRRARSRRGRSAAARRPRASRPCRSRCRRRRARAPGPSRRARPGSGRVGVVVLDADELGVLLERPLRRQVLGMEVVRDDLGLDREHGEVELEVGRGRRGTRARSRGRRGAARGRPRGRGRAEGALQLGAGGDERRRAATGSGERDGHVAARAPERERGRARRSPRSGGGSGGRARGRRRRSRRAAARVLVLEGDRLVRDVAAGQHERAVEVRREQVVERRVREHARRATATPARPTAATGAPVPPAHEHDRARGRAQQLELRGRDLGERLGRGRHHGERLLLAVLARAQPRDRLLVARVAGEVVAAEPLDGEDRAVAQQRPPPPRAASRAAARRRDSRSARRGSGGRAGPRTRAGSRRTARSGHRRVRAGRTGRVRTIVKRGPHCVQFRNG